MIESFHTFWTLLQAIAVAVIVSVLEVLAVESFFTAKRNYESLIVFDFIKRFSAMLIFKIFFPQD
jgi:hypothetical protein